MSLQQFRLAYLPVAPRVTITAFVLLIGIGYVTSLLHMFFTYNMADGKAGLTPKDVETRLVGRRDQTLLESKVVGGSMEGYLTDPGERAKLLAWIHSGADEGRFMEVQPIFAKNCVSCHSADGAAKFRPLTNFQQVAAVTQVDKGESPAAVARVAHIHLQSLGVIYLLLGLLFSFCAAPEWLKTTVVPLPFLALLMDFGVRALVPSNPSLLPVVLAGGALAGACTGIMILGTLWELWLSGGPKKRAPLVGELHPVSGG